MVAPPLVSHPLLIKPSEQGWGGALRGGGKGMGGVWGW